MSEQSAESAVIRGLRALAETSAWSPETETEPIHHHFSLSYANFLVMDRTLLQSMPVEWQRAFVKLLGEFDDYWTMDEIHPPGGYTVTPKDERNRFTSSYPVPHYNRGRTIVKPGDLKRSAA